MILKERLSGSFGNFAKKTNYRWNDTMGSCTVALAASRWMKYRKGTKDTQDELFHFIIFQRVKELSSPCATAPSSLAFYVNPLRHVTLW